MQQKAEQTVSQVIPEKQISEFLQKKGLLQNN